MMFGRKQFQQLLTSFLCTSVTLSHVELSPFSQYVLLNQPWHFLSAADQPWGPESVSWPRLQVYVRGSVSLVKPGDLEMSQGQVQSFSLQVALQAGSSSRCLAFESKVI